MSQFGKTHLSDSGFRTPEKTTLNEMNSERCLTEKDLVERVSSKLSSGSFSPPTKSILRGRAPSPKQGSPSSLRNVRFSDKDSDDEVMYAKIHVNKNIQTESSHKEKSVKESKGLEDFKLDLVDNCKETIQPQINEIKTSTPRYGELEDTPSLDFHTPRGREEGQKSLQLSPSRVVQTQSSQRNHFEIKQSKNQPENKHERIIIDIEIDRKIPAEHKSRNHLRSEPKLQKRTEAKTKTPTSTFTQDGNKIIQNMDLNLSARSNSPERKQPVIPDGKEIIRNMDLNSSDIAQKLRSTASQTSSSGASSPRSPSPESPYQNPNIPDGSRITKNMEMNSLDSSLTTKSKSAQTNEIPDGRKIIQNLEISRDSGFKPKSESVQTTDIPDGRKITQNMDLTLAERNCKNTSVEVQTLNPQDLKVERFRSVPVQTVSVISEENSPDDSFDNSKSRSIAVQTQEPSNVKIPDGSQIIRNMETYNSEKPKHFTDSADDKKGLTGANWNEFVRNLEMFNPSSSSSSSVSLLEDEPQTINKVEPVIVYDRNAPSPETVNSKTTVKQHEKAASSQQLNKRSARTFLESEDFTRHQLQSVLREEGLLSKFETSLKSAADSSVSAKSLVDKAFTKTYRAFDVPTVNAVKPSSSGSTITKQKSEQLRNNNQYSYQSEQKPVFTRPYEDIVRTGFKHTSDLNLQQENRQQRPDKEKLGFTPIETYSFNPETLMKTAAKRAYSSTKPTVETFKPRMNATSTITNVSPSCDTKESVTKNSFVQGLDLGPVPKSMSPQRNTSLFSTAFESNKPLHHKTNLSRSNTYRYGVSEKSAFQDDSTSSLGSFRSSTIANSSARPASMSGYQRSSYSHVTGHSLMQPPSDYWSKVDHYRPSSVPGSNVYPNTSTLSSSLKEMRNNALRKHAMHQIADKKWRSPPLGHSLSSSLPSYRSHSDYQKTIHHGSPKHSLNSFIGLHETHMQRGTKSAFGDMKGVPVPLSAYQCKGSATGRFSPRHVSPDRSDYLNALNDKSNVRPSSRNRSRSRSRSRSPISSPVDVNDTRYSDVRSFTTRGVDRKTVNGSAAKLDDEVRKYNRTYEDRGNFDSTVSTGHLSSNHKTSAGDAAFTTRREPRALTGKPPLPSRMKTSRSSSNGRSRSRSADRKAKETSKPSNDAKEENEFEIPRNTMKPCPVFKETLNMSENTDAAHDKHRGEASFNGLGTVTIGGVPLGLADPECMYLGHDTIQKIIDEARL